MSVRPEEMARAKVEEALYGRILYSDMSRNVQFPSA